MRKRRHQRKKPALISEESFSAIKVLLFDFNSIFVWDPFFHTFSIRINVIDLLKKICRVQPKIFSFIQLGIIAKEDRGFYLWDLPFFMQPLPFSLIDDVLKDFNNFLPEYPFLANPMVAYHFDEAGSIKIHFGDDFPSDAKLENILLISCDAQLINAARLLGIQIGFSYQYQEVDRTAWARFNRIASHYQQMPVTVYLDYTTLITSTTFFVETLKNIQHVCPQAEFVMSLPENYEPSNFLLNLNISRVSNWLQQKNIHILNGYIVRKNHKKLEDILLIERMNQHDHLQKLILLIDQDCDAIKKKCSSVKKSLHQANIQLMILSFKYIGDLSLELEKQIYLSLVSSVQSPLQKIDEGYEADDEKETSNLTALSFITDGLHRRRSVGLTRENLERPPSLSLS